MEQQSDAITLLTFINISSYIAIEPHNLA
uniref:Uncharacterized protein n=1 Tax=Anguilla anguilla TaxID=7936 RepID=A0A0E9UXC4_ANGAN